MLNLRGAGLSAACAVLALMAWTWLGGAVWQMLAAVLLWWLGHGFWQQSDKRLRRLYGALGALFAFALALALRLHVNGRTGGDGLVLSLLAALCTAPAMGQGFIWLTRGLESLRKPVALKPAKAFQLVFLVLILCWMPVYLACFPGITGYDMGLQTAMIRSGEYTTHHPLAHTLLVGFFMKLWQHLPGGESFGYALYTTLQYALLAASIAYAMRWLCLIRCPKALWMGVLALFALSPQHSLMAVSGTKDILFAAGMLCACVEIIRMLTEPERLKSWKVCLADVCVIAFTGLMRKNMIYALALVLLPCLGFVRKLGRRFFAVMLAGAVMCTAVDAVLFSVTDAEKGSVREMLSVPIQQLARIHDQYGLDEPVSYEVLEVLPNATDYQPDRADFVKWSAKVQPMDRMVRFAKLWLRELFRFPIEYIDAFLYTAKGYWDVSDMSFATTYDVPGYPTGCMVLDQPESYGVRLMSALPGLRQELIRLFNLNEYRLAGPLWMLLHPALYTWWMLWLIAWAWYRKNGAALTALCLCAAYFLTLLLGPCALIRYQYSLMLCAPVITGALCACKGADRT